MATSAGMAGGDPGWGQALRYAGIGLIVPYPFFAMWRMRKKGADSLTATRTIFVSWAQSGVWIVLILWLVLRDASGEGSFDPLVGVALACFSGILGLVVSVWAGRKPLDTSDADKLAGGYLTLFFLQMAMAQVALLTGFVCAFVTDRWWMVLVGVPFTVVGFALAAPTRGNLARIQANLRTRGSTLDLVGALLGKRFEVDRPGLKS